MWSKCLYIAVIRFSPFPITIFADYDMQVMLCWSEEKHEANASNTQTLICYFCYYYYCVCY